MNLRRLKLIWQIKCKKTINNHFLKSALFENMKKLIRITTVPLSLENLLEGQLNFMQKEYQVIAVSSDEKKLSVLGREIGVPTFAVNMTREITPTRDLKSVWKLYNFLKKEKPLIVHTHTPKAGITGMLAAKMAGVPIRLHTVAGLSLLKDRGMKWRIMELVEKITYACATMVYPNSMRIYDYLSKDRYISRNKLKVIGRGSSNGINTDYFDPGKYPKEKNKKFRKSLDIPENDLVFIFIGRLVRDKGINELVDTFVRINKEFPSTTLLLVGPFEAELDPLKDATMETIKFHHKIIEAGYQNDVRPFLACADVLVFPSYREGFPNVVMQAGAMNLPGIVTNINGCNEIVKEGINGTLIPVGDTEALYLAMKKIIDDENWRKSLASNARKIVRENFEREEIWKALLAEYKRLEQEINQK